ncbi:hypothetical protein [Burkholderia ambifaria]|nr:hypothetical protein [Burkholderia ambifaria]MBR7934015.1 hypothetical protein [Burkholderia ambifaria]QQC08302.1 hypothetical protein I6H84_26070 [Burkholderia ambifaria]UZU02021.1 hypothetical protein OR987_15090 [Burkholderia ambifaria]UZU08573.1 hypothetical protein OR988_15085 [Burkholderia ambifaria]WDS13181.1 hypothetical protein OR984_07185 [Burkholderia ambifaria]
MSNSRYRYLAAMRDAVAALERVDVLLLGPCVEHVIEQHTRESAALC